MGKQGLNLFEQYLFEAPEDEAPDAGMSATDSTPPPAANDNPPDMGEDGTPGDFSADGGDDSPPTLDDAPPDMGDDLGGDDFGGDDGSTDDADNPDASNNVEGLDNKVSSILNYTLYKRFLNLLTQVTSQIASIKNNSDILYTISADTAGIVRSLEKLEENIRIYLNDSFTNTNYTRNLLFFNKCLNFLNMTNDSFDGIIHEGIKDH